MTHAPHPVQTTPEGWWEDTWFLVCSHGDVSFTSAFHDVVTIRGQSFHRFRLTGQKTTTMTSLHI